MRGREDGFTLIEVMVAMAVLGLAVLALIRLGAANAMTAGRVEDVLLADIVAENAIVDALTQPEPPPLGETSGTVVNAGVNWTVTRQVARTENARLIRISVAVRGPGGAAGDLTAFRGVAAP
jgi:general secretion pathway protein I